MCDWFLVDWQSFDGRLELLYKRPTTIQRIRAQRPVWYVVHFPVQSPLPLIKEIVFNERLLCKQHDFGSAVNKVLTEIRLQHILYTGLANQVVAPEHQHQIDIDGSDALDADDDDAVERPDSVPQSPVAALDASSGVNVKALAKQPAAAVECGRADRRFPKSPLYRGGHSIQRGSWPWIAAIYTVKPTGMVFTCAGNLISERIVVTAAHCFRASAGDRLLAVSEVLIALGRHDMVNWMETGSRLEEVAAIVLHPDFHKTRESLDADIAVARLRRPIVYNAYIRPICLWQGGNDLADVVGSIGTVVGWGSDGHGQTVTQTPRSINIPIVSEGDCLRSSAIFGFITSDRSFCAGRKDGFGPCHGDSGSALAILRNGRMMLRGIVSAALAGPMATCDLSNYVLFTDVSKFVEWIRTF